MKACSNGHVEVVKNLFHCSSTSLSCNEEANYLMCCSTIDVNLANKVVNNSFIYVSMLKLFVG